MTPAQDVIVSVYTPPLTLSIGYVTVDGFWHGELTAPYAWRETRRPATKWDPPAKPSRVDWGT
jgi:hypothetical protein